MVCQRFDGSFGTVNQFFFVTTQSYYVPAQNVQI
jgi:hypothetical protein